MPIEGWTAGRARERRAAFSAKLLRRAREQRCSLMLELYCSAVTAQRAGRARAAPPATVGAPRVSRHVLCML
jgi:hypothetical protein